MSKLPQIILVLGCVCTLFFAGCSKKETMGVDNETQSVVDYAIVDQEFLAIVPTIYQSVLQAVYTGSVAPICGLQEVSKNTADTMWNAIYSLNVSNIDCPLAMPDGKARTGKLIMRLIVHELTNLQIVAKLENYQASGIVYSCDSMVLTTKVSNSSFKSYNVNLVNGACKTGTVSIKYTFNRTITVYPNGDVNDSNPVVYAYGDARGTNRFGTNFSTSVVQQTPLVKHKTCAYIDKGTMELTPQGFKPRTINFGDGVCDDEATFTVNENTVAFKLK